MQNSQTPRGVVCRLSSSDAAIVSKFFHYPSLHTDKKPPKTVPRRQHVQASRDQVWLRQFEVISVSRLVLENGRERARDPTKYLVRVPDRACLIVNFWRVQQRFVVFSSLACCRRLRLRERLLSIPRRETLLSIPRNETLLSIPRNETLLSIPELIILRDV